MTEIPSFLKQRPDGRYQDIRLKFKRGDKVHIVGGQYQGQMAVVDSLIGMIREGERWIPGAGYNILLGDGRRITIRWDLVEKA